MSPAVAVLLLMLMVSIVPYFLPELRRRLYVPFPGFVAVRFPLKGEPVVERSKSVKLFLDGTVAVTIILMLMGYTILVQSVVPQHATRTAAFVPLIPGVTIPFDLLINLLWIIAISIAVHEFLHYLASVWQGVPVRSAGVGLLFIFPIAFVEPDEEVMMRVPSRVRARIYSAGPAANAILAALAILVITYSVAKGIYIIKVEPGSPAWKAGLKPGDVIVKVNGVEITTLSQLRDLIESSKVLKVTVLREGKLVTLTVYRDDRKLIGIYVLPWVPKGILSELPAETAFAVVQGLFWTQAINMGLAIINALPMIITDGGKLVMELKRYKRLGWFVDVLQISTLVVFFQALLSSFAFLR